jgi:hypothetical protein
MDIESGGGLTAEWRMDERIEIGIFFSVWKSG